MCMYWNAFSEKFVKKEKKIHNIKEEEVGFCHFLDFSFKREREEKNKLKEKNRDEN